MLQLCIHDTSNAICCVVASKLARALLLYLDLDICDPRALSLICVESASRASFSFSPEYKNTHTIVRYFTDTMIFTSHTPPETKRTLIRTNMVPWRAFRHQKYVLPRFHARGDRFPAPSSSANSTACTTHTQHTYKSQNMIFPDTFVRAPREQPSRERSPSGKA